MGTVGLSFGSPTSGTGFDVSSTVASIVSNLQKVETPWQNQLKSLESQDSVISNMGTLFSNLSNDLSQLTDFEGVLAQKSGSSSDTGVLELTAASASATAGTHTVVVKSLAQTSSGYLDAISNSDTLAGSLTIGVNGNQQTFNMSSLSDQTLSGLAAAINSSGVGVTANVLTDASGSRLSLVSNSSGAAGEMTITSGITDANMVSGSNPSGALNYNDAMDGVNAQLTIDGVPLQSASNTVTNLIPGVTFQLLAPSPATGSSGGQEALQVVIANDNTQVESAVNQFVSDYNSLMSAITTQEGNTSSGTPEPLFGSPTISLLQQQLLGGINTANPNGYFDTVTNASDALSGSVTIAVGSGTPQTINVPAGPDNTLAGLAAAINSAYAGSASSVTASLVSTSLGSRIELLSNTAGSAGALTVTSNLTDTTTGTTINYNGGGSDISNLTSLGISVNNDGSLTFDANSLDTLLNSDFSSVENFFQGASSWGQKFSTLINNAGASSPSGILALASKSNSSIESALNAEITKENSFIAAEQSSLTKELNRANETLQSLPSQLDGVNELYSAITGYQKQGG